MNKMLVAGCGICSLLVLALISGFTIMSNTRNVSVVNAKGLDTEGVFLITPVDATFGPALAALAGSNHESVAEAAGPFGVLVQNDTANNIVGCSLKWDLIGSDGKITTLHQEYNHPGALIGMEPLDPNMVGRTAVVNARSTAFLSLDSSIKNIFDSTDSQSAVANRDRDRLARLSNSTNKQLKNVVSITVSIDGVVFDTGEFIGPDTTRFYKRIRAFVNAKKDLVDSINKGRADKKEAADILTGLSSKIRNSPFMLSNTNDTEYDQAYDAYFKRFVKELDNIKDVNDDQAIINYARRGSNKFRVPHRRTD